MLREPLYQSLQDLGLRGMARAFDKQCQSSDFRAMTFDERLGLLLDHERVERSGARLAQRLRWAKLPQSAAIEDVDQRTARGLERGLWPRLVDLGLPRKSGRCLSYAAIAAAACFSNCTGLRYPSDECRREGL